MKNNSLPLFYAKLNVKSSSYTYVINNFKSQNITLYCINHLKGGNIQFIVEQKDVSKTFAILDKMCYNYSVVDKKFASSLVTSLLKKSAIIVTMLVLAISYIISYGYVWSIKIFGTNSLDSKVLYDLLRDNGITALAKKSTLDMLEIEALINSNDNILLTQAVIDGTSLIINVTEKNSHTTLPSGDYSDITSNYDATVTKIVTNSGTCMVDVGQHIFKNSTLISASKITASGEEQVIASGTVYGRVTTTIVHDINLLSNVREDTGITHTHYSYLMFGKELFAPKESPFNYYRQETTTKDLAKNMLLPISVKETVYYEQEEKEHILDLDEEVNNLMAESMLTHIYDKLATDYTVSSEIKKETEYKYKLYIYLQAELVIGQG